MKVLKVSQIGLFLSFLFFGIFSCSDSGVKSFSKKSDKIIVLTLNSPTTTFNDRDGSLSGPEFEMVSSFAQDQGFQVEFKVLDTVGDVIKELKQKGGDFAAAGLTQTQDRAEEFEFGPVYQKTEQQVVCHQKVKVNKLEDLFGKNLLIVKSSSYEARLNELKTEYPDLFWETTADLSSEQILHLVWKGDVDCTIVDSNIVSIHRRFMPELKVTLPISSKDSLAWLVPKKRKPLREAMTAWFQEVSQNGEFQAMMEKYYGHVGSFDYYDLKVFRKRVSNRLPQYRKSIQTAAEKYEIPWELLAAVSYQESHWNPKAKSPTGVRGFMMLTLGTAASLGVTDRLNPEQSIQGGARYLRRMIDRIPSHVQEPDRTWMGLASYNVGFSHLKDARKIAVELNKDPNSWHAVKQTLPLLSQKKYYRHLKYGYARGVEPVIYVERIRNYYDLLVNMGPDVS